MKKFIILSGLSLFLAAGAQAQLPEYDIAAYCKETIAAEGGGYSIEEACLNMENEAKARLSQKVADQSTISHCAASVRKSYSFLEACGQMKADQNAISHCAADLGSAGKSYSFLEACVQMKMATEEIKETPVSGNKMPAFNEDEFCAQVAGKAEGAVNIREACLKHETESKKKIAATEMDAKTFKRCEMQGAIVGGSYRSFLSCVEQENAAKARMGK